MPGASSWTDVLPSPEHYISRTVLGWLITARLRREGGKGRWVKRPREASPDRVNRCLAPPVPRLIHAALRLSHPPYLCRCAVDRWWRSFARPGPGKLAAECAPAETRR